ncbi:hypothetical protein BS47DRAFT_1397348 [Hydnum rufescens UP504]|uniref:Uncharacterized protein n=1 Tax=Hydnum rufescens UP504 TaxID=1448309 RepID=A0A9P6ANE3_9AGAM|nr:hypothetical protein BS47DRAFT_1397348 [Hydnum rufescens UP504]
MELRLNFQYNHYIEVVPSGSLPPDGSQEVPHISPAAWLAWTAQYSERREGDGYRKCRHCPQDIGLALTEFSAFAPGVTKYRCCTSPIGSSSLVIPRSNPVARNLDPLMHPFANTRDDPEGHADGVNVVMRNAYSLAVVALPADPRKYPLRLPAAHKRSVTGRCFADSGRLLSCAGDVVEDTLAQMEITYGFPRQKHTQVQKLSLVVKVILSSTLHTISAIDHHRTNALFAAASHGVHIWDETKYTSGSTIFCCGTQIFDLPETSVLASTGSDRTFTLDKSRWPPVTGIMKTHANALAWSPTLRTSILLASEDHNLYIIRLYSQRYTLGTHDSFLLSKVANVPQENIELNCGRNGHIIRKLARSNAKLKPTMLDAQRVKEERRQKHSRAGETKPKAERRKVVGAEQS